MVRQIDAPVGLSLSTNVEFRGDRRKPFKARARWVDPTSGKRQSTSESFADKDDALQWIDEIIALAEAGVPPATAELTLSEYGDSVMKLAMRGLDPKTLDPYMAGWRKLVVPSIGHIKVRLLKNGLVDRAVSSWISDGVGRSRVKNALAALVRVAEQAVRDGLLDQNPCRVFGWQKMYAKTAAELNNPRALALPDYATLQTLAAALVAASADDRYSDRRTYQGWGDAVIFAACTACRIGEVSGALVMDIDTENWIWTLVRQTTPGPGGLMDKDPKSKRARFVPIMEEIRPMVLKRINLAGGEPTARLFTGPRGGRLTTAVLRDATHWDEVVVSLGLEHLRRHDLRHTGLTWMADAGVPLHVLRMIAGHGSLSTTQRYLHPNHYKLHAAAASLSRFLTGAWSPNGPQSSFLRKAG